ncbi:MAG: 30S ribosomal protein S2 [Chloroflexi bacterium]|nr:30S ribosomal protein S2 [Chloroflexota bacterium]
MSLDISMKALLESGVHFGHRTNRWNPRMKPFIFTERNGIHIIDLQLTVQRLQSAYDLIRDTVANGGTVLFVGTKRQAQETIQMEAERCGMPYVTERWLPGTLTNWSTIFARIMELQRLEKLFETGENERLVKKEQLMINREIKRLLVHLSGIRHMNGVPDLIFIVDVVREITAVHEANLKNVPVVAMVDTNCDPTRIDYPIPSNDDAIRAIKLIVSKVADAVVEGLSMRKEEDIETMQRDRIGEDEGRQRVRAQIQLEDDVDEESLLGASTLQKLADSRREEETVEVATDVEEVVAKVEAELEEVVKELEEKVDEEKPATKAKKAPKAEELEEKEAEDLDDMDEDEE